MATAKKPVPMCCVQISYLSLLMPAADGMKLVQLLQTAVICEEGGGWSDQTYTVKDAPRVEYRSVKASQVRLPVGVDQAEPKQRLLR